MKPGDGFPQILEAKLRAYLAESGLDVQKPDTWPERTRAWFDASLEQAAVKLSRRLGWFTRAHPAVLADGRMIVGLYSDGFSVSSAVWSDDLGETWTMSEPIVGGGNVQPSFAQRRDGTVVAFMRDNGPAPKLLQVAESTDRGETWTLARDHPDLVEPGAGNEVLVLRSGRWIVVHNDVAVGRHRLAVSISDDEGRSFRPARTIDSSAPGEGRFHYPSVIQDDSGVLHLTYSRFLRDGLGSGREGKTIQYATFDEAWLDAGDPPAR